LQHCGNFRELKPLPRRDPIGRKQKSDPLDKNKPGVKNMAFSAIRPALLAAAFVMASASAYAAEGAYAGGPVGSLSTFEGFSYSDPHDADLSGFSAYSDPYAADSYSRRPFHRHNNTVNEIEDGTSSWQGSGPFGGNPNGN
jgi:hypothetical protein